MIVEEGPHVIAYPKLSSNVGQNYGAQERVPAVKAAPYQVEITRISRPTRR